MRLSRALALVVLLPVAASADVTSQCSESISCLRQTVQDLRDYRQYLEDQLALAKNLLSAANARIAEQAKELQALKHPPEKK